MFYVETITYRGSVVFTERERFTDFDNASRKYFMEAEDLLQGSEDSELKNGFDLTDMIKDRVVLGVVFNIKIRCDDGTLKKHSLIYAQK